MFRQITHQFSRLSRRPSHYNYNGFSLQPFGLLYKPANDASLNTHPNQTSLGHFPAKSFSTQPRVNARDDDLDEFDYDEHDHDDEHGNRPRVLFVGDSASHTHTFTEDEVKQFADIVGVWW